MHLKVHVWIFFMSIFIKFVFWFGVLLPTQEYFYDEGLISVCTEAKIYNELKLLEVDEYAICPV